MGAAKRGARLERGEAVEAVLALKAGKPPRRSVRHFTVGANAAIRKIENAYIGALSGSPRYGIVVGDYGEGKSHLLCLAESVARRARFVYANVVHDRSQHIGIHKPGRLFRKILQVVRQDYPNLDVSRFELNFRLYQTWQDRAEWRQWLATKLSELASLAQECGYEGLAICIDELEDCMNLWHNQFKPAYETMNYLLSELEGPVVLLFGTTTRGFQVLVEKWNQYVWWDVIDYEPEEIYRKLFSNRIEMPEWSALFSEDFCARLIEAHGVAFDWKPTFEAAELADRATERARFATGTHWRTFVQSAVTELEVAHQRRYRYALGGWRELGGGDGESAAIV